MIAVVGGGLAGCAAAVALARKGLAVQLFERSRHLGGRAGTPGWNPSGDGVSRSPFGPLDTGQHVFLRCCRAYTDFLGEIGALGKVRIQPRLRVAVYDGSRPGVPPALLAAGILPAPFHMAPSVLRYPFLSWRERLGLSRVLGAALTASREDPALSQKTFSHWLRDLGQTPAAIRRFWDVIIVPTLNAPSDAVAAEAGIMVLQEALLRDRHGADIGWATVPLSGLLDGVAPLLNRHGGSVRMGCPVRKVARAPGGGFWIHPENEPPVAVKGVIFAVHHRDLSRLLPAGAAEDPFFRRTEALEDAPIVDLHFLYDRPLVPRSFSFATFIHSEVQWLFQHRPPAAAPPGSQHLSVTLSAAQGYRGLSNEELRDRFARELARLFPGSAARVIAFATTRQARATFVPAPGSWGGRLPQRTPIPGVFLAGDWTDTGWPATMEGAVRSGRRAAAAAADYLRSAP